ncbi:MAG TPA: ATP cone domain-containing protein [Acidobacteriota bacterium]|nr:ATP cone domain-containing protein [Acidobacteriota bacterium]
MTEVIKGKKRYPFSKGILAKSITRTGIPMSEIYEIVNEIQKEVKGKKKDEVASSYIKNLVCECLIVRGYETEERYYRITREIKHLSKPLVIMIGGGTGVGKSTIAAEVAHRLGITHSIGSDGIREIMRYMVPYNFMPILHESSFIAGKRLENPYVKESLIFAFTQQVNSVAEGVHAFIKRGVKEGIHTMVNGIHLVPGYIDLEDEKNDMYCFHYILHLSDVQSHIQQIYYRSEGSRRDPERYVDQIKNIRDIQSFIKDMAEEKGVKVIENDKIDKTINTIMEDIVTKLEEVNK